MADYVVTLTGKDNLSNTIKTVKQELNSVGGATSKLDTIQKKFDTIQKLNQNVASESPWSLFFI